MEWLEWGYISWLIRRIRVYVRTREQYAYVHFLNFWWVLFVPRNRFGIPDWHAVQQDTWSNNTYLVVLTHIFISYIHMYHMYICVFADPSRQTLDHTHTPSFSLIFCCLLWLRQSGRQLGELLWCLPFAAYAWPCDLVVFSIAELDHGPMDCLMMISWWSHGGAQ